MVYANTLPVPEDEFFNSGEWKSLVDRKSELMPKTVWIKTISTCHKKMEPSFTKTGGKLGNMISKVTHGAAISANPGVNPSLSFAAMTERAKSFIPKKK